jgi:hypothetical protein
MNDDVFGEAPDLEREPQIKVIWPLRPASLIEGELLGRMGEAMSLVDHRAPPIWIEDDQWCNAAQYAELYGELTLHEALAMQQIVYGDVQEQFRRQLIVARELGESATVDLYLLACELEGIDPILNRSAL